MTNSAVSPQATRTDGLTDERDVDVAHGVVLRGRHIDKWFGSRSERRQVLFDVSVDVRAGECLAVIGGSGSGKSTLTRILLGLEAADAGTVAYAGRDVASQGGRQALRSESGLVYQDPFSSLNPRWTVVRSVGEPSRLRYRGMSSAEVVARCGAALETVGLEPASFLNRYPVELSGGQAQRVAIARAIVNHPKVLLADEPMSAIDVAARIQILEAFAAIRERTPDMALIVVSHDLGVVQHLADRIVVLHDGRIEEEGATNRMLAAPRSTYTRALIEAAS